MRLESDIKPDTSVDDPDATPTARPMGEGARDVPPVEAQTTELAAATRLRTTEPATSPVSVYVPTRYDGRAGFMGGRGLY